MADPSHVNKHADHDSTKSHPPATFHGHASDHGHAAQSWLYSVQLYYQALSNLGVGPAEVDTAAPTPDICANADIWRMAGKRDATTANWLARTLTMSRNMLILAGVLAVQR